METDIKIPDANPNKWLVFTLVGIGVFMSTLDASIVNIALPAIMQDFQVTLATVGWVLMAYLLTVSSLLLAFGRLSDIKGRRWVYCRGFFIFSVGSLFCGVARSAAWLIAARSFQGIGAAMLMACSPALVVDIFPSSERGKTLGMVGTVVAAGLTIGPALGGLILNLFSWRVIFYINIPIGIAAAVWAAWILKGSHGDITRSESFDMTGALLLVICFCSLLIALTRIHDWGCTSLQIWLLLGVSITSAIWFIRVEARAIHPIFDLSLLKIRLFVLPSLSAMILFISLFSMLFLMPFYLVNPSGFSMDKAGYLMVTPFVFLFFISPFSGALSDRIGSRILCTLGMAVMAVGLFSLSLLPPVASSLTVIWRLALVGIGTAIFISPNSSVVLGAVYQNRRGIAAGTVATARNMGMVIGVALAEIIFNNTFAARSGGLTLKAYGAEMEPFFMAAFQSAMLAGCFVAGLGIVVAFLRGPENNNCIAAKGHLG